MQTILMFSWNSCGLFTDHPGSKGIFADDILLLISIKLLSQITAIIPYVLPSNTDFADNKSLS